MAQEVEELFGQGPGAPKPRVKRVYALTAFGFLLAFAGLVCSSVPGGVVILVAWLLVEREGDRVESGYLPREAGPVVTRARRWAGAGMISALGMFLVQGVIMCTTNLYKPVYDVAAVVIIGVLRPEALTEATQAPAPGAPQPGPGVAPAPVPVPAPAP